MTLPNLKDIKRTIVYNLIIILVVLIIIYFIIFENELNRIFKNIPYLSGGILGWLLLLIILFYRERNSFYIQYTKLNRNFWAFFLITAMIILPIASVGHDYLRFLFPNFQENNSNILTYYFLAIFVIILFVFFQHENFLKKYRSLTKIVMVGIVLLFFWPFILNLPLIPYHINGFFFYNATDEINKTSHDQTSNLSDNEEKVRALMNWQLNNMTDVYGRFLTAKKPYIVVNRALNDYNLTMYYKQGVCGDFGILLSELATASGIENRRVYAPGENHEWVEVKINNSNTSWANADASFFWPERYIYNDFSVYSKAFNKLSRVYYIEAETNKQIDVTRDYSTTGNLGTVP